MCVPARPNLLRKLHHQPVAKCPSNVLLQIGNDTTTGSPPDARTCGFNAMLKIALLGSCLAGACYATFASRGTRAMLRRIDALARDLDASERLRRGLVDGLVDDQLELRWERQHVAELERTVASLNDSFGRVLQSFHEEEKDLVEKNEALHEASDRNATEASARLSREAATAHMELENEEGDNALLKKEFATMVSEMRKENIPLPPVALRGASAMKL